jgi:hypothetical protein
MDCRRTVAVPLVRRACVGDARAIALVHIASSDDVYAPLAAEWPADDPDERTARWARNLGEERRSEMQHHPHGRRSVKLATAVLPRRRTAMIEHELERC